MNLQAVKQRFGIIGRSEKLNRALDKAIRVANTDLTVLILGESGVGKEAVSKIIHQLSSRKHSTFIAINTGALPEGTINSELFGHDKGAFTGAISDRKGYFETAEGGTIFLDEVSEMPLDTQAYLLRVLESGEFIRVGSSKVQKSDVRVIAATNVELLEKVKNGKFREDLFYRLNTVPIRIPSLKERREDIYMLFRKFALDFAEKYRTVAIQLDPEAKTLLVNYYWPGNVRELRNVVEQMSIFSEDKLVTRNFIVDLIPDIVSRHLPKILHVPEESLQEREILYKVLFDMKNDLNDLKSLIFELVQTNNLRFPETKSLQNLKTPRSLVNLEFETKNGAFQMENEGDEMLYKENTGDNPDIVVSNRTFDQMEVIDDSLSLEDMEKEYISKALKKHNSRRKEAALDLGISERTLYRKIKYYGI